MSLLGTALSFATLDLTGRASDLGVVLAARTIPQVLFLLVGGVLTDRLRRHRVMVITSLASAASHGVLAAVLLTGTAALWQLAVLAAVNGTAVAFFFPAAAGIVLQLVARDRLQAANALLRLARSSSQVVGAAVAGVLVAATSPGWDIAVDAASYLISALILLALRPPLTRACPDPGSSPSCGRGGPSSSPAPGCGSSSPSLPPSTPPGPPASCYSDRSSPTGASVGPPPGARARRERRQLPRRRSAHNCDRRRRRDRRPVPRTARCALEHRAATARAR